MSGDVQPRKRKDKKRKKDSSSDRAKAEAEFIARKLSLGDESDEASSVPGKGNVSHTSSLGEGDSFIHVHHEVGTGGHWCAKIVFFSLLAILIFLIGLILVENRGLTDLDVPVSESRYAQVFDGWVDEGPVHDDHHDEHTLELKHGVEESHEEEHDDHTDEEAEYLEEEHGHTDYEHSDGEEEDEAASDEDEHDSQEYLEHDAADNDDDNADDDDDDGNADDDGDNDTAEDDDDSIHEIDYNGDEANDDDDDDEYLGGSNENDDEDNADNDSHANESVEDDDAEKALEEVDSNEEDVVDNSAGEEQLLAAKKAELQAQEEEESGVGMRVGIGVALVVVAYCVLARKFHYNAASDDDSETPGDLNRRMTLIDDKDLNDDEEEVIEQPPPITKIIVPPVKSGVESSPSLPVKSAIKTSPPMSAEATRIRQVIHRYIEDDDEEPQSKEPTVEPVQEKKQTGVAAEASKAIGSTKQESVDEDVEEITREEIQNMEAEYEQEEEEELGSEEEIIEDEEEEIEEEEDVIEEEEEEISDDGDDAELLRKLEEKYGKLPQQDEDQAEGHSDDEPPPVTPARKKGKPTGGNTAEDGEDQEEWVDDTSNDHWKEQLELAQAEMDEGHLDKAYRQFTALTLTNKTCPLAKFGRAKVLEAMAETKRSNDLLDKTIEAYREILEMKSVNNQLFLQVADRTINKMRFRGKYIEAVPVHYMLITKFPDNVNYRNDLAITYLMVNKVTMARKVLTDTLSKWPNDAIALVHYGFILKTEDNNLIDGVKFMQKGIDIGGKGTLDGRFLFHLGDAYARLGNQHKANKVYEMGASVGVFLSPLQRSLYNVNRLTGRPWWEPEQTPYGKLFDNLEKNWKEIAAEAKKLHPAYEPEHENLKDKGEWSQFQLFVRGKEFNNNCLKCPITCGIVKKEISAWNCRRGQVKFSAMQPGTHVFAHTGPTNCRIRAHLGLIGTDNTYIRVANETRSWKEGSVFIFDDSFEHEVWHNGTELRIVLIVDLWHPELTRDERLTLPAI